MRRSPLSKQDVLIKPMKLLQGRAGQAPASAPSRHPHRFSFLLPEGTKKSSRGGDVKKWQTHSSLGLRQSAAKAPAGRSGDGGTGDGTGDPPPAAGGLLTPRAGRGAPCRPRVRVLPAFATEAGPRRLRRLLSSTAYGAEGFRRGCR